MAPDFETDAFAAQLTTRLLRHYSAGADAGRAAATAMLAERLDRLAAALNGGDRYLIRAELDRGGMGRVCLAHDRALGRDVAFKQARSLAGQGQQQLRLLAESSVVGRLQHPGIVPVHDVGIDADGAPFFVMPRIAGQSLADAIAAPGADWPLARRIEVLRRVAETMAYAHSCGVVHRDLKPHNVMVGAFGEVYVMDWGLARRVDDDAPEPTAGAAPTTADGPNDPELTVAGTVLGTPAYLPPERARGAAPNPLDDVRGDVYAAGAMLYEFLTGRAPFVDEQSDWTTEQLLETVATRAPRPVRDRVDDADPELVAICERAMHREPAGRYADMQVFADELRAWSEHRIVHAHGAGTARRVRKWIRRNRAVAATVAPAAAILLTATIAFVLALADARDRAIESADTARANLRELLDLAVVQRITALQQRADDDLWPAHVDRVDDMRAWLIEAEALSTQHERLRRRRAALADEVLRPDSEASWRGRLLDEAVAALDAFFAAAPTDTPVPLAATVAAMQARIRFAIAQQAAADAAADQDRWRSVRAAIEADPRFDACPPLPLAGLVPIGDDPTTGLPEFAHLHSGEPATRDRDGRLVATERTGIVFVLVPGGTFRMGAAPDDPINRDPLAETINEQPVREVTLAPFLISKYELTQAQWTRVTGNNPSVHQAISNYVVDDVAHRHPVESVDWHTARTVLRKLGLALPSEAQWEYAARAGSTTPWPGHADEASLLRPPAGNLADDTSARALGVAAWNPTAGLHDGFVMHAPVGSFPANAFGLHDVIGNVAEWCDDEYVSYRRDPRARTGHRPLGPAPTTVMYRGGAFDQPAPEARSANRAGGPPTLRRFSLGIRPVRNP